MSWLTKKSFFALVAGAVILTSAAGLFIVQAYPGNDTGRCQAVNLQRLSPDQRAQQIADKFGVDKAQVLQFFEQGSSFRDISRAAFLANTSKQSLSDVLALKTADKTWKDVAQSLGVTPEQIKTARQEMTAVRLEKLQIPKTNSLEFMGQGYRARDIAIAYKLAENTGKSPAEILNMREINNTWRDVAQTLGVSNETLKQDLKDIGNLYPHKGRHHGCFPRGN